MRFVAAIRILKAAMRDNQSWLLTDRRCGNGCIVADIYIIKEMRMKPSDKLGRLLADYAANLNKLCSVSVTFSRLLVNVYADKNVYAL